MEKTTLNLAIKNRPVSHGRPESKPCFESKLRILRQRHKRLYEEKQEIQETADVRLRRIYDAERKIKILEKHVDIGVLIETPAAALISESIAKNCDFLAIGTNDLTMYTLAIDRGDEEVAKIYDPAHLSVLRLIKLSAESAKKVGVPISVCGEMAGDTIFTSLLLGMGINKLSRSVSRILKVKQFIKNVNYNEVKKISNEILAEDDSVRIKQILKSYYDKIYIIINS